ncbi:hypothetical protein V1514DRAFT_276522 [Lipomyces japonicus]|uniref:uncharacterized protein n=1 Tax=Lipomyces japonicus TaxID=56871 RepID=UPI0034CF819E
MAHYDFTFDNIPDLQGKTAIVTGGNSGIGEVISRELASKGAKVYIAGRSEIRVRNAIARIRTAVSTIDDDNEKLQYLPVDFESQKNAVQAAKLFAKLEPKVDIIVANAGVAGIKSELTAEGWERTFAHLGHFAFVTTLLPLIRSSAEQAGDSEIRIVVTSSRSYERASPLELTALQDTFKGTFAPLVAYDLLSRYSRSKLANLYFARQLSLQLRELPNVYVNAHHPGLIATNIFHLENSPLPRWMQFVAYWQARLLGIPVDDGAKAALFLAADKRVVSDNINDKLIYPGPVDGFLHYSYLYVKQYNALAQDLGAAAKLWEFSEHALGRALEQDLTNF